MTDDPQPHVSDIPLDGAPTWVRVLQAALIGVIAGLALHAILSVVVLQGKGLGDPARRAPAECKKAAPARDAVQPTLDGAPSSGIPWVIEGQQARR
jgi:hypothetical protein